MAPPISKQHVEPLRQPILNILKTSDLSVISAKKVRAALAQLADPSDPARKLASRLGVQLDDKEHKSHVDALIRECFDKLNGVDEAQPSQVGNGSVTQNVSSNGASAAAQAPAPKIALPGMGGVPGSHVASAPKSSTNDIKPTIPSASGVKRKPKNDDIVSEDEDGDIEAVKRKAVAAKKTTTSVKKKRKTSTTADGVKKPPNPNNPFNKPVVLSAEMSRLCGAPEMPRYEITKALWAYIKERDLQNPANKRQILCDPTLTSLFGKSTVDSFEMAKLISKHVSKKVD